METSRDTNPMEMSGDEVLKLCPCMNDNRWVEEGDLDPQDVKNYIKTWGALAKKEEAIPEYVRDY